jgi:hypothetical protein
MHRNLETALKTNQKEQFFKNIANIHLNQSIIKIIFKNKNHILISMNKVNFFKDLETSQFMSRIF